jgi:hypothetical protein
MHHIPPCGRRENLVYSFAVSGNPGCEMRISETILNICPALSLATICIFVRSVFRVAELSEGFGGKLANQEVTFMILEGAMIVVACLSLTVLHPGIVFEKYWEKIRFSPRMYERRDDSNRDKIEERA